MLSNWGWSILLPHIDLNIIVWYSYINILLDIMIEKLNFYTYLYINIYELLIWVEYSDCFPILIGSPLQSSGSFLTASVVWVLHSASHLPQKSGWDGMPDKVRIIADFSDLDSQRTREKKKWIISHSKFRIISQRLFTILSCEIFARCHLALNLVNLFILFPPESHRGAAGRPEVACCGCCGAIDTSGSSWGWDGHGGNKKGESILDNGPG